MAKISFPHIGELWIAGEALFYELGIELVPAPRISRKTINLGVRNSPEFACLPFKINVGNYLEARELGADLILMAGGIGPCRFGFFGEVQREILKSLDFPGDMVIIEPEPLNFFKGMQKLGVPFSPLRWVRALELAWEKIKAFDYLEEKLRETRPVEAIPGQADELYRSFLVDIRIKSTPDGVREEVEKYRKKLAELPRDFSRELPVSIGIVGEIYLILEPFSNLRVEEKLGRMGVRVFRSISISSWIQKFLGLDQKMKEVSRFARPHLKEFVGGHGQHSIGQAMLYKKQGMDGIIQVAPFTCMPEIVAKAVLKRIAREYEFPVLPLFFDEHSGEEGLKTRLEAFIDLILQKKTKGLATQKAQDQR